MPNQPDQNQPAVPDNLARLAGLVGEMRAHVNRMDAVVGSLPRAERIEVSRRLVPLRGELDSLTEYLEHKAAGR